MNKNKETKEKICAFYASDYHFEMMSLPYINKNIENENEIVILTENNLEKTMKTFLERTNLKEEKKEQILKINWRNNNTEKWETIKTNIQEEKDMVIFIKGKEKYIKEENQNIEKFIPENRPIKIIDCYSIDEIGENIEEIMDTYKKVLRTTGEKEIEKI